MAEEIGKPGAAPQKYIKTAWTPFRFRLSRLHMGFLGQAYGQLAQVSTRLLEVPLFLHFWGPERYGEWLVVTAIPGLLTLGDFGVSQSAVRGITTANAGKNFEKALEIFQSAALVTFVFSALFAVMFLLLSTLKGAGSSIGLTAVAPELLPLLAILAVYTMISMQSLLMFGVLQSAGRYPLGFTLLASARVMEFSAVALAVALGAQAFGAAAAMLASQIVSFVVLAIFAKRSAFWMKFGGRHINVASIRALIKPSAAFAAFPIAQAISMQASRLLIGGMLGPAAVVIFTTHRQLARFLNSISNFMLSVQGELGLAYGGGDLERYRRLAVRTFRALALIGLCGFVMLLVASPWVYARWTAGRVQYDGPLFVALLVAAFAETLWRGAMAPAMATNRHEWIALSYLVVQVLCIPAMLVLMKEGLRSLGIVVAAAEISMLGFVLLEFRRLTGVPAEALFRAGLWNTRHGN